MTLIPEIALLALMRITMPNNIGALAIGTRDKLDDHSASHSR